MNTSVSPCIASSDLFASLSLILPSHKSLGNLVDLLDHQYSYHEYTIKSVLNSESSSILFLRDSNLGKSIVMKVLYKYKDSRYCLETISERQHCQLKALYWNRLFTPNVYLGLAKICDFDPYQKKLRIDKIVKEPNQEMLDPDAEYGLVMRELPQDRRLDYLLNKERENKDVLQLYVEFLAKRVANMHKYLNLTITSTPREDGILWGSIEQLREKLIHNLSFADLILQKMRNEDYNFCFNCLNSIKDTLPLILSQHQFRRYFELRKQKQYIKRCHADLKATNIWLASDENGCIEEAEKIVWILDAVDFNNMYSNIDILSDFATLLVDIQARTKSLTIADYLLAQYLNYSDQQDEVSLSVLAYYLVEKAFVGAILSIIYDNLPDLGLAFLEVAEMRLKCLSDIWHKI